MQTKATGEVDEMHFNSLKRTNQKLRQNPEISDHNKEVLNDFFRKARSGGAKDPTLRDYSSRFNKLAEVIDFQLDSPEKRDLERLVNMFNTGEIRKNNGHSYSDYSKNKFWKTISRFYSGFIKKEGKGYNEDIDGPELIEDLQINADTSTEVNPDKLPTPEQIREVSRHTNSLRDKAIILFGWATGARIGELVKTNYKSNSPLKWKDLEFGDDKLWVKLDGKTGERDVPVKTAMPVMRQMWENDELSLEDPVFRKQNKVYYCPECGSKTDRKTNTTYRKREYRCQDRDCNWEGGHKTVEKTVEPLTDNAVRRVIERSVERADLEGEFETNPHDFFRKARAVYKARIGFTDHQMRAFFGWSETSDAPKHYLQCVKEDLEKALAEEFGEEVDYEKEYDEEALRPVECAECSKVNSATVDMCVECGSPLTEKGEQLTKSESKQGLKKTIVEKAEEQDLDPDEFEKLLEKPFLEVMENLNDS